MSVNGDVVVERNVVEIGQTVNEIFPNMSREYEQENIDPGEAPEGDYLGWSAFTNDGNRVLLTNRITDNVTVFDWNTREVLANIDVGDFPSGIACNDDYAVVACSFSDEIYIIDLIDYSIVQIFDSGEQPWVIRLSQDGTKAFVSCDIDDVCEVIDLETLTHENTILNFPVYFSTFSYYSNTNRNSLSYTGFEVLPDGNHLIVGDCFSNVLIFNVTTGQIEHTIPGIELCWTIGISGDGTKAIAVSDTDELIAYQIDLQTFEVTATVEIANYSLSTFEIAVNQDGTKAYAGITGNSSAILKFETSDHVIFSNTFTPFWIGESPDHSQAIGGQNRFSIIDFETETMLGQYQGIPTSYGVTSPTGFKAVGYDTGRYEGLHFYDYSNPNNPSHLGSTISGLDPEGDAPRRVAISPNGTKAVVANPLSGNASIINIETNEVEAILEIGDRVQEAAITSDSEWAVVTGFNSNSVKIINLNTNEIAADVLAGSKPTTVCISPDDSFAYVGNVSSNSVSVIALDGENSYELTEIPCGTIGLVWAAKGVTSDIACSPNGDYILVPASFDDSVEVISTETNQVVASLPAGDFPIQLDFNADGTYAIVTNYFDDTITLMFIDGANSSVVGNFPVGDGPLRMDYDPVNNVFGIANYYDHTVTIINPENGSIINTLSYANYGDILQIIFDENGDPIVLTSSTGDVYGRLHQGEEIIELPAVPTYFEYNPSTQTAVVVMPGPDFVTVINWDAGVPVIAEFSADPLYSLAPLEVQFSDTSTGPVVSWEWDFDNDGTIDSNQQNPVYTYLKGGLYSVSLTVGDGTNLDTETKVDYIEVSEVGTDNELTPNITSLSQNHPNPFNPSTIISFSTIESTENTELAIYNLKGQKLKHL